MTRLMSAKEVAPRLGVAEGTIYQWVMQKRIPFIKVGRALRFDEKDISDWLNRNKVAAHGDVQKAS